MKWLGVAAASVAIVVGASACGGSSGGFCSTHTCIANFNNGKGYIVQCVDGEWSHSGGEQGACSYHGGERSGAASTQTSAVAPATTTSASPNSKLTTLVFNRSVGSLFIGEGYQQVQYEWGDGKQDGCTLMNETPDMNHCDENVEGPIVRYKLPHGYVRVGFSKDRVVYIETNSPAAKTASGFGVGSQVPYGKRTTLDGTAFRYFGEDGGWQAWTKQVPIPRNAKYYPRPNKGWRNWVVASKRLRGTLIFTNKGAVTEVIIVRGDVNLQL